MAAGTHYASPREFPVVWAMDGVGGSDIGPASVLRRSGRPYGAMAEPHCASASSMVFRPWKNWTMSPAGHSQSRCVGLAVSQAQCGSWSLAKPSSSSAPPESRASWRYRIAKSWARDASLAQDATTVLSTLHELGADSTIRLDKPMKN